MTEVRVPMKPVKLQKARRDYAPPGPPMVSYGHGEFEGAVFEATCPECKRFVKPDLTVRLDGEGQPVGENATCKTHGRVAMPFVGYV